MAALIVSMIISMVMAVTGGHQPNQDLLPRCSQHDILKGITKIQDPFDNKRYFVCENDILTLKHCKNDEVFDSVSLECISLSQDIGGELIRTSLFRQTHNDQTDSAVNLLNNKLSDVATNKKSEGTISEFKCPNRNTRNYQNEDDCRRYYHCEDGVPRNMTCPPYFLFDIDTYRCQFFLLAKCYQAPTTIPPPNCSAINEDIPFPQDCKRYYHCYNGERTIQKCGFFSAFDRNKRKCRFFLFASCENSETLNVYSELPSKTQTVHNNPEKPLHYENYLMQDRTDQSLSDLKYATEIEQITANMNSDVPQCGANDTFKKPIPHHCKSFYDCNQGVLKIYKCFFIFSFDPVSLSCTWFWKVNCHNWLTTTVPTTLTTTPFTSASATSSPISTITNPTTTTTETLPPTSTAPPSSSSTSNGPAISRKRRSSYKIENNENSISELILGNEINYECSRTGVYDEVFPDDCHKYYHCDEGSLSVQVCSLFKNFDPIEKRCRWFFLVDCSARPVIVSTTTEPTTLTSESTESTTSPGSTETSESEPSTTSTTISTVHTTKTTRHKKTKHHRKTTTHKKKTSTRENNSAHNEPINLII